MLALKRVTFNQKELIHQLKNFCGKGHNVGSNNVNLSKEGVIVGNENTLDIGDDDGGGDYSTYDFIGNFVGGGRTNFKTQTK